MKFSEMELGQKFWYLGETWVKTGPTCGHRVGYEYWSHFEPDYIARPLRYTVAA